MKDKQKEFQLLDSAPPDKRVQWIICLSVFGNRSSMGHFSLSYNVQFSNLGKNSLTILLSMEAEKVSGWEAVCKLALTTVANNNRSNGIRKHNVAKNRSKQSKNQIMDWIFIVKCSPLVTCQFCEQFELENMINATFSSKKLSARKSDGIGSICSISGARSLEFQCNLATGKKI